MCYLTICTLIPKLQALPPFQGDRAMTKYLLYLFFKYNTLFYKDQKLTHTPSALESKVFQLSPAWPEGVPVMLTFHWGCSLKVIYAIAMLL